jgi:ABC transporter
MPFDGPAALQVRGHRKAFSKVAVDHLDQCVRPGELYALLGPNGAGKTTTLRMVGSFWWFLAHDLPLSWRHFRGFRNSTCTALINLWHPAPGKSRSLIRQHVQSKVVGLIEHLMTLLWAVATGIAISGSLWTVIPVSLALALLWLNRQRSAATVAI